MSRTGLHMSSSPYATKSWNAESQVIQDLVIQDRMSRRDQDEWCNRYGYSLDIDERSPDFSHLASKPKVGGHGQTLLQNLPGELRNKIYAYLAENVHVVGISDGDENGEGGVTCVHPLAYIKPLRSGFLGWIEKNRLPKTTNYIARVENFDFGRLMEAIKQHDQFRKGFGNVNVHIYLDFTKMNFDISKVLEWAGDRTFVRSYGRDFNTRYAVGSMPDPVYRDRLMTKIFWFHRANLHDHPLLGEVMLAIRKWWGDGDGMNDWCKDKDMDDGTYDPKAEAEETADDFNYDHNMNDSGDVVMEDPRNHDDILNGRKDLALLLGLNPELCDPSKYQDPAKVGASKAEQTRQRWRGAQKSYNGINGFFGLPGRL